MSSYDSHQEYQHWPSCPISYSSITDQIEDDGVLFLLLNFDFEEIRPTCRYTRRITRHIINKCLEKGISSSEAHVLADHQDSQILDTAAPRLDDRNSSFCFILLLVI